MKNRDDQFAGCHEINSTISLLRNQPNTGSGTKSCKDLGCDNMACEPFLRNEWTNTLPRRDRFLETNSLWNTVSMDTETENCQHLENQTVASELTHRFRDNAFHEEQ
jgi:hypothetical protein